MNFQLDTGVKHNIISHNVFKTKVASVTSVCGRNKYAGNEHGGVPSLFIYLSVVESLVRMFIKHFSFRSLMRTKCKLFIQIEVYFGQDYIIFVSVPPPPPPPPKCKGFMLLHRISGSRDITRVILISQ